MKPLSLPAPLSQLLRQIGQIHFQDAPLTGLAILLALASVGPWAAAGMAFASAVAFATARLARLPADKAQLGLYGYNAALSGAGLFTLFEPSLALFGYLALVSIASAFVSARWVAWGKLPALTIQFVVAMWGAWQLSMLLGLPQPGAGCAKGLAQFLPCGIGQVNFIGSLSGGLAVWLAITIASREQGLWLGLGAAAGWLASYAFDSIVPGAASQAIGLAVNLALIAQGLTVFGQSIQARCIGIALGAPVCLLFGAIGLPYFTLPFNLVTWLMLWLDRPARLDQPAPSSP